MFDWLGDLISGIGDAIGGAFDYIGESIANTIFNSILQWLYEIIYGAISDFFEMIGNMGAEIFDLSWVQATVRLFTLFGWSLFAVGTVVAIFDVAIEYQNDALYLSAEPQGLGKHVAMEPAGFRNYGRCRPALHSDPCGAASDASRSRHTLLWVSYDPHG